MIAALNKPPRDLVKRIAQQEADEAWVTIDEILGTGRGPAYAARKKAWARILAETGCSAAGLAYVWGCGTASVERALGIVRTPVAPDAEDSPPLQLNVRPAPVLAASSSASSASMPQPRPTGPIRLVGLKRVDAATEAAVLAAWAENVAQDWSMHNRPRPE